MKPLHNGQFSFDYYSSINNDVEANMLVHDQVYWAQTGFLGRNSERFCGKQKKKRQKSMI